MVMGNFYLTMEETAEEFMKKRNAITLLIAQNLQNYGNVMGIMKVMFLVTLMKF